ncbi:fiber protein [Mastadenovirus eidoli]|uniref:Fiber protein n=1 Tax=Eidolon helvum adenovirus TaxID=2039267 RepID=A0A348FKH7_9ADEN|nr:fiber protein [Eidolon helvum adenovirus]BBF72844.1 fiber protein [Eidolon helvum adenovirus]
MKRKLDDLNPVYPYTAKRVTIMPPFYDPNGFIEKDGALSLRTEAPIDFDDGQVSLKLGVGLTLGPDGELQCTGPKGNVGAFPPLKNENGNIVLELGEGMTTKNDKLSVDVQPPLKILNSLIGIKTDSSFLISDETLKLRAHAPLETSDTGLVLKTGDGLETQGNILVAKKYTGVEPILVSGYQIFLTHGNSLSVSNKALDVKTTNPIDINDKGVGLKFGKSLKLNEENELVCDIGDTLSISADGKINTIHKTFTSEDVNAPLSVQNNKIKLNIGKGLKVGDDNTLNIEPTEIPKAEMQTTIPLVSENGNLKLQYGNGLTVTKNRLVVSVGDGLSFNSYGLIPNLASPFYTANSKITMNVGPGLGIFSDALNIRYDYPLAINQQGLLSVATSDGLYLNGANKLTVKRGKGVTYDETGAVTLSLGVGMTFNGFSVEPNLGHGLLIDSDGKISTTDCGLWTGADPVPNIWNRKGILKLCLTRVGPTVLGTVQVEGLQEYTTIEGKSSYMVCALHFDKNGSLLNTSDLNLQNWGCKKDSEIILNKIPDENKTKYLMPNKSSYKNSGDDYLYNQISTTVPIKDNTNKFLNLVITLNCINADSPQAVYTIIFSWGPFFDNAVTFKTGIANFAYVAENKAR